MKYLAKEHPYLYQWAAGTWWFGIGSTKFEDIKSVEVVTNPGARYDATVTAVIRIQTIRRAGDGFGFDLRSSYYQSQNVDLIEQLNVNYRHNGLDIFGIFRYLKNEYIMKNDIVHTLESDSLWKYQNLLDGTVVDKSLRGEIELITAWMINIHWDSAYSYFLSKYEVGCIYL